MEIFFGDRFFENRVDRSNIYYMAQNSSVSHRILRRGPRVAHHCFIGNSKRNLKQLVLLLLHGKE